MNKTVEMYADGFEIIEIALECKMNEEQVFEEIRSFRDQCKIPRGNTRYTFTDDFKELLASRYQSGAVMNTMSKEIQISSASVHKYLKDVGVDTKKVKTPDYEVIQLEDLECCPTCQSKRNVRPLGLHNQAVVQDTKPNHFYCVDCGDEWYRHSVMGKKDGKEVVSRVEVRKVIWSAVN